MVQRLAQRFIGISEVGVLPQHGRDALVQRVDIEKQKRCLLLQAKGERVRAIPAEEQAVCGVARYPASEGDFLLPLEEHVFLHLLLCNGVYPIPPEQQLRPRDEERPRNGK